MRIHHAAVVLASALVVAACAAPVAEQDEQYGKDLYKTDPDLCCALRKVKPLADTLSEYDAWATGLRRAETHNRVIAPVVGCIALPVASRKRASCSGCDASTSTTPATSAP